MTFRIGFPTLPPLTDPNFGGALQRDIDDLSKGLATEVATGRALTAATVWTAATLLNSWVNYGGTAVAARYAKDATGTVYVQGLIKNGTTTAGTSLLSLPVGYRPSGDLFITSTCSGLHVEVFVQGSTGNIGLNTAAASATYLSLTGIIFKTEQ